MSEDRAPATTGRPESTQRVWQLRISEEAFWEGASSSWSAITRAKSTSAAALCDVGSTATAPLLTKNGLDTWFFISVDYALGHALVNSASQAIAENGGKVLGIVKHPLGT